MKRNLAAALLLGVFSLIGLAGCEDGKATDKPAADAGAKPATDTVKPDAAK